MAFPRRVMTTGIPCSAAEADGPTVAAAKCMHASYYVCMATSITIRNVPEEVRNELAARAALSGRSLQEYLRHELIEAARKPSRDVVIARARDRVRLTGSRLSAEAILQDLDAERR